MVDLAGLEAQIKDATVNLKDTLLGDVKAIRSWGGDIAGNIAQAFTNASVSLVAFSVPAVSQRRGTLMMQEADAGENPAPLSTPDNGGPSSEINR